jgi:hypothetical protein
VTEFVARTHPAPRFTSRSVVGATTRTSHYESFTASGTGGDVSSGSSGLWGEAKDLPGFKALLKRVLRGLAESNGPGPPARGRLSALKRFFPMQIGFLWRFCMGAQGA